MYCMCCVDMCIVCMCVLIVDQEDDVQGGSIGGLALLACYGRVEVLILFDT